MNNLKLALIELEYAAADNCCRIASTSDSHERRELNLLRLKLKTAKEALNAALDALATQSDLTEMEFPRASLFGVSPEAKPPMWQAGGVRRRTAEGQRNLAAIVEGAGDAIISKTLDGIVTSWNGGATRLFGYSAEDMVGRSMGRLVPVDLRIEERQLLARLSRGEPIEGYETTRIARDGRLLFVSVTISPLRDLAGNIVGASQIARDITDRKRAEDGLRAAHELTRRSLIESQCLSAIVVGSEDAVISKNTNGLVTSWNAAATRIFGYTAEEMIGQSMMPIIPPDLQDEEREIVSRLTRGERLDPFDTIRLAKNGRRVFVSLTVSPIRDTSGNVVGASNVARDVTERKRAEQALLEANEGADRARVEAETANRAKTEFLAILSHEIRTPLNSINGFVDLLTRTAELTAQERRYASLVKTANSALLTVVNDILDFSKVEAGQLELELRPFSLSALVRDTIAIVEPAAAAKNLVLRPTVEPDLPEWVSGDESRLRQVLLNLLQNAVKFTEAGAIDICVRAQSGRDRHGRIRFSVGDTGIGIAAQQQQLLLEEFLQSDSSVSRRYGGTGLGLAICKRIVELMDGEIGIESEIGRGATVWFTVAAPLAFEPEAEPLVEASTRKRRILVIDDTELNLELVDAYLEDTGYLVDCVRSGIEAIQMLGVHHYDLVLMDIQMPIMDGVTTTKRIRGLPSPIKDIPIIAMTGNVLPQQVRSFLEAGMNDHVEKPIERAKLHNNLLRWLARDGGSRPITPNFDYEKFDEFVLVLGSEKAQRIIEKLLVSLRDAFEATFVEAQQEAYALLNTAGSLGMERFVEVCRRAAELSPPHDPDRSRMMMEELWKARSLAVQILTTRLMPKLRGESRTAA